MHSWCWVAGVFVFIFVDSVLIRLAPRDATGSVSKFFSVKLGISGRGDVAGNAKQGAKSVERVEAAVEAKRELVEICL
jgi:hypothetical protein